MGTRLSRAQDLVDAVLTPLEELLYVGVPVLPDGPDQVVAITTHRVLRMTAMPGRREWESAWWPGVVDCRLVEVGNAQGTLRLRRREDEGADMEIPGLDQEAARGLFALVEEARMRWSLGILPSMGDEDEWEDDEDDARAPAHASVPDFECGSCGREVEERFTFCPDCGESLRDGCPSCGHAIQTDFTVCPYCATPLAARADEHEFGRATVTGKWVDFKDEE